MYVKMYKGPDPVKEGEESWLACFDGRVAPCQVCDMTERYRGTHTGFAELKRDAVQRHGPDVMFNNSVPASSAVARAALANAELIWEGIV